MLAFHLHTRGGMNAGIHRIIERQAATHPDAVAVIDGERSLTYCELNRRANAVARALMDHGLRRGSQAVVNTEQSPELAVVLLALLKAGAAYTWLAHDGEGSWPAGVSVLKDQARTEQQWHAVDIMRLASSPASACPNLPIVTRPGDVACVMRGTHGAPAVLVPHATITALGGRTHPRAGLWTGDAAALDLWVTLMAGATAVVNAATPAVAAA